MSTRSFATYTVPYSRLTVQGTVAPRLRVKDHFHVVSYSPWQASKDRRVIVICDEIGMVEHQRRAKKEGRVSRELRFVSKIRLTGTHGATLPDLIHERIAIETVFRKVTVFSNVPILLSLLAN